MSSHRVRGRACHPRAFERATARRNKITLVHKHNVLVNAGGLWNRLFNAVAAEYPSVTTDYLHVDAARSSSSLIGALRRHRD